MDVDLRGYDNVTEIGLEGILVVLVREGDLTQEVVCRQMGLETMWSVYT